MWAKQKTWPKAADFPIYLKMQFGKNRHLIHWDSSQLSYFIFVTNISAEKNCGDSDLYTCKRKWRNVKFLHVCLIATFTLATLSIGQIWQTHSLTRFEKSFAKSVYKLIKRKIQVSSAASTAGINFSFVLLPTTFDRFQQNFIFLQDNF